MHVLILGAAGMVGRKLIDRLVRDEGLNGKPIERLTLADVVAPEAEVRASHSVAVAAGAMPASISTSRTGRSITTLAIPRWTRARIH